MIVKIVAFMFKAMVFYLMNLAMYCAIKDLNEFPHEKIDRFMLSLIIVSSFAAQLVLLW